VPSDIFEDEPEGLEAESGSETSEKSFQNLQVRVHDEDNILYENK